MSYHFLSPSRLSLIVAISIVILCAAKPATAETSGWDGLVEELKANYPALIAQRKQAESLGATPEANMAWMEPMIEVGMMNLPTNTFRTDQEPMTEKGVTITQPIPNASKREAATELAKTEAEASRTRVDVMAAELVAKLKKSAHEIAFVDRALEVLSRNEKIMDELTSAATAKYAAGTGPQASVIQAQVERSKLLDKRLTLTQRRKLACVTVNRLLGRPLSQNFTTTDLPLRAPSAFNEDTALSNAAKNAPSIREAGVMVEKSRRALGKEMAGLTWDYSVTAKYGQREPQFESDLFSIAAGVNVPLWRTKKQDKMIAGARLGVEEAEARLVDAKKDVEERVRKAAVSVTRELETIRLYKTGIIPQATLALSSARSSYQLDKTDFASLLNTEITLLQYGLDLEEAVMRLRDIAAEVESLTGSETSFTYGAGN